MGISEPGHLIGTAENHPCSPAQPCSDSADRSQRILYNPPYKTQLNRISLEEGYFQCHSDYLPSVVLHKGYCEVNDPAVEF